MILIDMYIRAHPQCCTAEAVLVPPLQAVTTGASDLEGKTSSPEHNRTGLVTEPGDFDWQTALCTNPSAHMDTHVRMQNMTCHPYMFFMRLFVIRCISARHHTHCGELAAARTPAFCLNLLL